MSSFGGSVKLTGESEYRKALGEITSNLKVLNSEMKTVTSLYDKNDTSVENLSSQNEILNKKIAEQQKAVNILADALEKSKAETGENSKETKEWQTKLNNAQAELNKMNREVESNTAKMADAVKSTNAEADAVEEFGKEAEESGGKSLKLGDIIKANLISDAIKGGLTALVDGFKAIGSAMGECLTAGAEYADNILTLSAQTGLSTDTLEKYNAVAELTDVSMETLTKSMAKNIKSMSSVQNISAEASVDMEKLAKAQTNLEIATNDVEKAQLEYADAVAKGGADSVAAQKKALALENAQIKLAEAQRKVEVASQAVEPQMNEMTKAYAKLGVSAYDAQGNLRDGETVYWEVIDALGKMENETERDALGMQILGKSAQELNTIIEMGSEGVAEYTDKAVSMGAVLGGEGLEALGKLDDQMQIFTSTTDATKNILASAFAPAMTMALEGVNGLAGSVNGLISAIISGDEGGIESAMTMVSEQVTLMVNNIGEMAPQSITIATDLISTLLQVIADNLPFLIESGVGLLSSLLEGITSNLDLLISCIFMVIETLLDVIIDNLDLIIEMGITLIIKLAEGLVKAVPQLVSKIPQIVTAILNGFGQALGLGRIGDIGKNLVEGIWSGISNATQWVLDKIKGFGQSILDGIKGFFGIHSPSRLFKSEIGTNLALGVGEGFADTMKDVSDEMNEAIPTEFDADISTNIKGVASSPMTQYDTMVLAFKKALTEVKVVMDDREMGGFVADKVERLVFA